MKKKNVAATVDVVDFFDQQGPDVATSVAIAGDLVQNIMKDTAAEIRMNEVCKQLPEYNTEETLAYGFDVNLV